MKTAIVTASTQGIGKAISVKLMNEGCYVIINYSNNDIAANQFDSEMKLKFSNQYKIIKADMSSYKGLEDFFTVCLDHISTIDYLILNAGITLRESFMDLTIENWIKVMDTNLNIPFFTVQKFSNYINNGGRIIFISSILGQVPHSVSIPYGVSKAGVQFLAKSLVKEFSERKITVNAVCPGFVNTQWQNNKAPDVKKNIEKKIALHRFAEPEEVSNLVFSILTNDYINGSVINIDGGYSYR